MVKSGNANWICNVNSISVHINKMDRFITRNKISNTVNTRTATAIETNNRSAIENETRQVLNLNTIEDTTDEDEPLSKKKKYAPKYRAEWENDFKWLKCNKEKNTAYCTICNKNVTANVTHLKRHDGTLQHSKNVSIAKNTPNLENFGIRTQLSSVEKQIKVAEYKIIMFLQEHNLPFYIMEHIPQFLKSLAPDSQIIKYIKCSRTKATEMTKAIAEESIQVIKVKLSNNKLYSLIIDETTDIATQKSLVVLLRYFDDSVLEVKDVFFGLIRLLKCDASSIYDGVKKLLESRHVSMQNMIGFGADNAAVMMGNRAGVQRKLKDVNPTIFILGCTCHSMHLCASAAAQKLPRSIEEFCRNIFNHFSNSSQRSEILEEFQKFVNLKPAKMLHPSQTRWLSLQAVTNRILESWDALKLYFNHALLEEKMKNTQIIFEALHTPIYKIYLLFLSYILDIVNRINLEFQSQEPRIHSLLLKVKSLYRTILRNFIAVEKLNNLDISEISPSNPDYFLPEDQIYLGAKVEKSIKESNISEEEIRKFKSNALAFYVELSCQIRQRFKFQDPVLNFLSNFDPEIAVSGRISSIIQILDYIPQIIVTDLEDLNTEWRLLADIVHIKEKAKGSSFVEFWSFIFCLKNEMNEVMFPNLSNVVKAVMTLPHSSACAERIFSQLTLLKRKERNRLLISTCDNILHSKELLKPNKCYNWEPTKSLLEKKTYILPD